MDDAKAKARLPFSGYYKAAPLPEDPELTHVMPGTPCGEYMRRFWHPVAMTAEVGARPHALRILGEDLVLFRDKRDAYGLLHKRCSHRGASLEFGIISECGIRCCYHGWLFDVDGRILETPGEPETNPIRHNVRHGAYKVREFKGLVFAYMGPPEQEPPFPILDTMDGPADELVPYSLHSPCNWLQVSENAMDPFHSVFLHARVTGAQFPELAAFGELPLPEWHDRPFGFFYTNARRVGEHVWVRMHDHLLPNFAQNGSLYEEANRSRFFGRPGLTRWVVPVDNTNTKMIAWRQLGRRSDPLGKGNRDEIGLEKVDFYGQTAHRSYEQMQDKPGDWDAWTSQGPINLHKQENLGSTDKGVALLRRRLRRAIRDLKAGKQPPQPSDFGRTPIHSYAGDTVVRAPRSNSDDQKLILEVSRKVAEIYVAADEYEGDERAGRIEHDLGRAFPR